MAFLQRSTVHPSTVLYVSFAKVERNLAYIAAVGREGHCAASMATTKVV